MRIVLPAVAAMGALAPASALAADSGPGRVAEELSDPARQEQAAVMAEAMAAAVLEMPAAPLLRAAETMAGRDPVDIDPDVRIGDLMDPRTADAPREFARRVPEMMAAMAVLATALEAMLPRIRELGDRIEDAARDDYE